MANFFDQFDAAKSDAKGGNFFDRFDAAPEPDRSSPTTGFAPRLVREGQSPPVPGMMESALRGVKQGFTGNMGDELQALAAASPIPGRNPDQTIPTFNPVDVIAGGVNLLGRKVGLWGGSEPGNAGVRYDQTLARQREADQTAANANPVVSTLGNIGGMLANPLVRALPASGIAQGARSGATIGAIYGAGEGEDMAGRASGAVSGAIPGAVLGGVIGKFLPSRPPGGGSGGGGAGAPMNAVVEAGERAGVDVPRFLATNSKGLQAAAQAGRQAPLGGARIEEAVQGFRTQVGDAAERAAQSAGSGNALQAGEAARGGLTSAVDVLKTKTSALYDKVDALVDPATLSPLSATRDVVAKIAARRQGAALDGGGKAADAVLEGIGRAEGLSYQGIKDLRTSVGEMLKPGMLPQGASQAELKQIYGALSKDLEAAVSNAGGKEAVTAWQRANQYFTAARDRQERLVKIIGVEGDAAGERVFDKLASMAGINGRADMRTLMLARKSMAPDEWGELASGVIQRLGRAAPDAEFSADRFMTQWSKMSNEGKSLMFGGQGALRQSLDDIATLSARMKDAEKFANRSNTGRVVTGTALLSAATTEPMTALAAVVGGRVVSSILSKPATAQAAARWSKVYANAVQKPSQAAGQALQRASAQFGAVISKELGIPQAATDIGGKLLGTMRTTSASPGAPEEKN